MPTTASPRPMLETREKSYGQDYTKTVADRFGHWLSERQILGAVGTLAGKRVGDFGCGFNAEFVRPHLVSVAHAFFIDVAIADDLKRMANVTVIEGTLPDALEAVPSASLDVVLCNNILEHLAEPESALRHCRRIIKPGGVCFFNVPSWRGKFFLELAAFRLKVTSAVEIDEHKDYFAKEDLWRLLVKAGWRPSEITCRTHKFGLNTYAVCRSR
jgi:SAM-dependent methyltransferase